MRYEILTSLACVSALDSILILQNDVNKALAAGGELAGGVTVTFEPDKGYLAFQALLMPSEPVAEH